MGMGNMGKLFDSYTRQQRLKMHKWHKNDDWLTKNQLRQKNKSQDYQISYHKLACKRFERLPICPFAHPLHQSIPSEWNMSMHHTLLARGLKGCPFAHLPIHCTKVYQVSWMHWGTTHCLLEVWKVAHLPMMDCRCTGNNNLQPSHHGMNHCAPALKSTVAMPSAAQATTDRPDAQSISDGPRAVAQGRRQADP